MHPQSAIRNRPSVCQTIVSSVNSPLFLTDPVATDQFLAAIGRSLTIAVDTEGASFHRFIDRIYLLQITTRLRSAIIDPLTVGTPTALGRMLENPEVEV